LLAIAKRFRQAEGTIGSRKVGLPKTVRLDGKTLALIGVGKTGAELAKFARGFGIRVIAIKQTPDPALAKALGIAFMGGLADLPKVLAEADFVSLHLPNNRDTVGFLGRRQFAQMKPGALLVNIARAPMIDKAALQEALVSGHLGGAGLDVCWQEPIDPRDPLLALPNVIVTPHIAGDTEELELRLAELAAANIRLVADSKKPAYVVGVDIDPL
jgi:glyoxylate reductase